MRFYTYGYRPKYFEPFAERKNRRRVWRASDIGRGPGEGVYGLQDGRPDVSEGEMVEWSPVEQHAELPAVMVPVEPDEDNPLWPLPRLV